MPYKISERKRGFTVSTPNGAKGRNMTLENAKAQVRLLQAIEHNPKFKAVVVKRNK